MDNTKNNDISTTVDNNMPSITKEGAKELYKIEITKFDRRFLTGFCITGLGLGFALQLCPDQTQYLTDLYLADLGVIAAGAGVLTMFFAGAHAFDSANTYTNDVAEYVEKKFHLSLKD